jgi:hypothetical protein
MQEVCSEFMCDKSTSPLALAGYAVHYGIDIYVVDEDKRTYMTFLSNSEFSATDTENNNKDNDNNNHKDNDKQTCWIYKDKQATKYMKYVYHPTGNCNFDADTYCRLEQFDKPLQGISHYKVEDLAKYEQILRMDRDPDHDTKKDRYERICKHMTWVW